MYTYTCTLSHFVRQKYTATFEHGALLYTHAHKYTAHVSTLYTNARSRVWLMPLVRQKTVKSAFNFIYRSFLESVTVNIFFK